jgi:hypothetical protein
MDNPGTSVILVTHNTQNEDKQNKNKNGQPRDIGYYVWLMLPMSLGCSFLFLFCLPSFCVLCVTNVTDVSGFNTQNEDKQNKNKNGQPRDIGNISHT